jgi:hypothetical protein
VVARDTCRKTILVPSKVVFDNKLKLSPHLATFYINTPRITADYIMMRVGYAFQTTNINKPVVHTLTRNFEIPIEPVIPKCPRDVIQISVLAS